ncbi:hypothetical protein TSUD_157110 [Trifolium subterraneum]|uniref:Pentatricopeptide repeat-containing protein n=1 Tax=Trifolium subterraneum TaxID=3900 RepID=A0A2Z6M1V0_TRISU|nr:hypothetical protein TSUD_157110 [Trifolium subterraneum]
MAVRMKHAWTCSNTRWMKSEEQLLSTLESCDGIKQFNQVHTQLIIHGLFQHSLVASRAIKKLCSHPRTTPRATLLFDNLHHPDAFLCNTIIRSYLRSSNFSAAFSFYYYKMIARWVPPNHYTFPLILKLCTDNGCRREGEKGHARVIKFGFEFDLFVRNSLIRMYSVFGRIYDARLLFDASYVLDLVSYNTMIDGYVKNGEIGVARKLFDEMNVVSWNSLLALHVRVKNFGECLRMFERMIESGEAMPNEATLVSVLTACANLGKLSLGALMKMSIGDSIETENVMLR